MAGRTSLDNYNVVTEVILKLKFTIIDKIENKILIL